MSKDRLMGIAEIIAIAIVSGIVLYFCFSYVLSQFNPFYWGEAERSAHLVASLIMTLLVRIATDDDILC